MVESLERALRLSRLEDAERIVQRAIAQIEEVVAAGGPLDAGALAALSGQAAATSLASGDPTWAHWVLDIYGRIAPRSAASKSSSVWARSPSSTVCSSAKRSTSFVARLERRCAASEVAVADGQRGRGAVRARGASSALERLRELRAGLAGERGPARVDAGAAPKAVAVMCRLPRARPASDVKSCHHAPVEGKAESKPLAQGGCASEA